ncbi:MAG: hypothetical protein ACRDSZ_06585 [Pseudonocardiaceae bacterium]
MLLAGIDIQALTGADAVEVLRARARQLSHDQARLLAAMVEVGLCAPDAGAGEVAGVGRSAVRDRGAGAERDRVSERGRHRDRHRVGVARG